MDLPQLDDHVGSIANLENLADLKSPGSSQAKKKDRGTPLKKSRKPKSERPATKIVSVQEVSEDSESEDEDLVSYEKPDSDPSDSEEDPTLIQRSKPNAPV